MNKDAITPQREIDLTLIQELYVEHADALRAVRDAQRAHRARYPSMKTQLDDVEAEVTYLLLRYFRPQRVVEIGSLHGWSTTWLLQALRDNGTGRLITIDLVDGATGIVPDHLAVGRWEFRQGDARTLSRDWMFGLDYLFVDADHRARFARWYLTGVFPDLAPGTPVGVHDVFHRAKPLPYTEGAELLRWQGDHGVPSLTMARAKNPEALAELDKLRARLGFDSPIHAGRDNPMVWFRIPL